MASPVKPLDLSGLYLTVRECAALWETTVDSARAKIDYHGITRYKAGASVLIRYSDAIALKGDGRKRSQFG